MKKFIVPVAIAAAVIGVAGCGSDTHKVSKPKKPVACEAHQDTDHHVYCPVATPKHTGANTTDSDMWIYYVLWNQQLQQNVVVQNSLSNSMSAGSSWRAMPPGFTLPSSAARTGVAVKVDPESGKPEENPEAVESDAQAESEGAVVESEETNSNPSSEISESGEGSSDGSSGSDGGAGAGGGEPAGGGDAPAGGGDGGASAGGDGGGGGGGGE